MLKAAFLKLLQILLRRRSPYRAERAHAPEAATQPAATETAEARPGSSAARSLRLAGNVRSRNGGASLAVIAIAPASLIISLTRDTASTVTTHAMGSTVPIIDVGNALVTQRSCTTVKNWHLFFKAK